MDLVRGTRSKFVAHRRGEPQRREKGEQTLLTPGPDQRAGSRPKSAP